MNINLNEDVRKKLRGMGSKNMTIYSKPVSSCWSPRPEIFVKLKEPEVPEGYKKYDSDNISVYIYKDAVFTGDTVKVELAKHASDLANKDFDVDGLKI